MNQKSFASKLKINKFGITIGLIGLLNLGIGIHKISKQTPVNEALIYQLALSTYLTLSGARRIKIQNDNYRRLGQIIDENGYDSRPLKMFIEKSPCDRSIARAVLQEREHLDIYQELCEKYPLKSRI